MGLQDLSSLSADVADPQLRTDGILRLFKAKDWMPRAGTLLH
jgi:hypothetical protein